MSKSIFDGFKPEELESLGMIEPDFPEENEEGTSNPPNSAAAKSKSANKPANEDPFEEEEEQEEEQEEEEESDDPSADEASPFFAIATHFQETGIFEEIPDDFDGSEEGFLELAKKNEQKKLESYKASILRNPLARDLFEFLETNPDADINSFVQAYSEPDYSRIDQEELEENAELQKVLIRNQMLIEGATSEEIEEELEDLESAGLLFTKSKRAIGKLQKYSEVRKEMVKKQAAEEQKRREAEYKSWLDTTKKEIESLPDIAGFVVTPAQKTKFYEYLTKVDKDRKTQYQKDVESEPEKRYWMAWYWFNKFNFEHLKKGVKREVTKSLKEKVSGINFGKKTQVKSKPGLDMDLVRKFNTD